MAKNTGKKESKASAEKAETEAPDLEAMQETLAALRSFAVDKRYAGAIKTMQALGKGEAEAVPHSLLFEGGSTDERLFAALYWAALLNCNERSAAGNSADGSVSSASHINAADSEPAHGIPCLSCPECLHMISRMHRDCFFLDGRSESIKIEAVREMRAVLGEAPREALFRVVILCEAQSLGEAAANALLKSLEEPRTQTSFVLLTPQRERLLPTLVSRSWIVTLPWPAPGSGLYGSTSAPEERQELIAWGQAILELGKSGKGWMDRTSRKGSLDKNLALKIVLMCQHSLMQALSSDAQSADSTPLAKAFAQIPPARQRILNEIFAESQESLEYAVNPALVMDWLATRLYFLLHPVLI